MDSPDPQFDSVHSVPFDLAAPSPRVAFDPADRFIPLRAGDLATALVEDAAKFGLHPEDLAAVFRGIGEALSRQAAAWERSIADLYSPFNPDRDTRLLRPRAHDCTPAAWAQLEARIARLFDKANFEELDAANFAQAVREASSHGLRIRIRPDRVDAVRLWVRGRGTVVRTRRTWRSPVRGRLGVYHVYRRMAVMARLKGDSAVHLKVFRDIPVADVEALLPHAEVHMSWADRVKVVGGSAGAFAGVLLKLAQGAMTLAYLSQLLWLGLAACGVMGVRAFLGYRRTRKIRDGQRTHHLYYQLVASNPGALSWVVSMIAQEEEKEAMLAYALCSAGDVRDEDHLRSRASAYLRERFGVDASFDAADAVRTLRLLGFCAGDMRVQGPHDAMESLMRFRPAGLTEEVPGPEGLGARGPEAAGDRRA